jgi:hypothetical protein
MQRRQFIQASAQTTALASAAACGLAHAASAAPPNADRELYEWRTYRFDESGKPVEGKERVFAPPSPAYYQAKHNALHEYLRSACLPAWQRLGLGPVGVFTEVGPEAGPSIHVLLTYPDAASLASSREALESDAQYHKAAAKHVAAKRDDPAFERIESSLMLAFASAPKITTPAKKPRVLELRTYENHNEDRARAKVAMFNDGEIGIFPKCGFENVFFGETLIGAGLPSLKYMLAAPDLAANEAGWKTFLQHPDFLRMNADPKYADTFPNITKLYLQPTDYSQV